MVIHQNIYLYWDKSTLPSSVRRVYENWSEIAHDWNVEIYCRDTAIEFLKSQYGKEISWLFETCRIPAMQADVFRVFVVLSRGGLYSDLTYEPQRTPGFISETHGLTAVKNWQGNFTNSVFYGHQGCPELEKVAREILHGIRCQENNKIWSLTGPGAWFRAISPHKNPEVYLENLPNLMRRWLRQSRYEHSTRGTPDHWSNRQKSENIFAT